MLFSFLVSMALRLIHMIKLYILNWNMKSMVLISDNFINSVTFTNSLSLERFGLEISGQNVYMV